MKQVIFIGIDIMIAVTFTRTRKSSDFTCNDPDQGDGSKERPIKSSVVLPPKTSQTGAASGSDGAAGTDPGVEGAPGQDDTVEQTSRMNLRDWDPSLVIKKLYEVKFMDEVVEDISHQFITMEGLMEKLPMNKKKATLLKTWKRRFFRAKDGWLYYYETSNRERPSETIQLMGGSIIDLGNRVLGIDDGRGRYLMVRCPTEKEHGQWVVALESQTADNTKATYVRPALAAARHPSKKVVVIDLGSSAIRAGVLGDQASLPELFLPSVLAVDSQSGKVLAVGQDALAPSMRQKCNIVYPIRPSNKVDQFNIEVQLMGAVFSKVFQELRVKPSDYWVMLSTPQNLGDPLKRGLMQTLVDELSVVGVCMVQQALLSLHSYNTNSGIIVDIGHRIEILPIFDGFVIEGGVARCPYGAQKVQESLTTSLLGINYKFHSEVEQLLVRHVMEESCYVAIDYAQEEEFCKDQPQTIRTSVNFAKFNLPEGAYGSVEHDLSRFKSPEGFFNVDLWEMDYPTLQKLIHRAIQTCPMDNRRHMWRAVFLSGGVTMMPGFAERLERELTKLAPPGVPVEVHAAPQRYHAAFVGACSVAMMPQFEGMAISRGEWRKEGARAFRKWQTPS
ncbi:histone-lysine N-methyltransferase SETMAR [Plakobranchus ocellatus]|uniref:Histone-lysine N-methyltransferase SETMAR n=1 Tax=Plakobranchus ocellatus TaxID=259542 RepID=A0AAV4DK83_9GAST|nr:histone-lysine N-methyltransferase SETMAR [Plakobranchus ocellatus]